MSFMKFKLLCWKNWIIIKRHWLASAFEIILPLAIVALFTIGYEQTSDDIYPQANYRAFKADPSVCQIDWTLGYSPRDNVIEKMMQEKWSEKFKLHAFEKESDLENWLKENKSQYPGFGVAFDTSFIISGYTHLSYTIRPSTIPPNPKWMTDKLFDDDPSKKSRVNPSELLDVPEYPPYVTECFLYIQNSIDRAFINDSKVPEISFNAFSYPEVRENFFHSIIDTFFPFLFVLCMILPIIIIIKNLAMEREAGLKESMKLVGLTSGVYWLSWFFRCFLMLITPFTINTILLTTKLFASKAIFGNSNVFIVWLFFTLYVTSVITYGFLISVIFKKASTATHIGWLLFVIFYLVYASFRKGFYQLHYVFKMLLSMIVNANMEIGVKMLLTSEKYEEGIHFKNFFDDCPELNFSFGELLIFMALGSLLQWLLMRYIESVFPGQFGVAKPWYNPLVKFFSNKKKYTRSSYNLDENENNILEDFEAEPKNLKVGVKIDRMWKKFGNKYAVKNLSLNMYQDQITVLLGHNGAGKTTTMCMLVGLFSPTSGTAFLKQNDKMTNIENARKLVGVCPQHDILFNDLTVKEHIIFFCNLKGLSDKKKVNREVNYYANLLGLKTKIKESSRNLSGGMKRKLSIAIALCAGSKIVILDEPTSGIDPGARKDLWNVLVSHKKGRTILLSTHFMDEADVLGDRIAIMSEGTLRTAGSPFFLKKKFGTGYRLVCVKNDKFNSENVLKILKTYDEDLRLEAENETEAIFIIDKEKLPFFEELFKKLEDNLKTLGISSFGCNLSTLEDVFIRLGGEMPDNKQPSNTVITIDIGQHHKVDGWTKTFYQIEAILWKKFHILRRSWKSIFIMAIFSIFLLYILSFNPKFGSNPSLEITLNKYDETVTFLESDDSIYARNYQKLFNFKHQFEKLKENEEMAEFVLDIAKKYLGKFTRQCLVGATFKEDSITAWFNGQPYHSIPLTLNLINRAIVMAVKGNYHDIKTRIHPVEVKTDESENFAEILGNVVKIINTIFLFFGLFILYTKWPFVFTTHYVQERETNFKLMQFISGMSRFVYWLTSFAFDFICFFIICCSLCGLILSIGGSSFKEKGDVMLLLIISVAYGFSMLPFSYLCSFLFKKSSTFIGIYTAMTFLFAIVALVVNSIQAFAKSEGFKSIASALEWIFMMFPQFTLVNQMIEAGAYILKKEIDPNAKDDLHNGILKTFIMNFISGLFYLILCILIDLNVFTMLHYKIQRSSENLSPPENVSDIDVQNEIERVQKMRKNKFRAGNLVLQSLTKYYKKFLAVNKLYLEVAQKECFGLLGVNGAGKTTTFQMMIGQSLISSGDVLINGYSIKSNMNRFYKQIGYCPQFDGLLPQLTGQETLKFFALIRGISQEEIRDIVYIMAKNFGFLKHMRKQVSAYSGGNKRKLSTALAFLGNPQIIFLDEPTTGIDPQARRLVWNAITKARNMGQTIILTSHSMDECEALCTRIGIMVAGQFKCLGSAQHLKNKYSKGFVITIKMLADDDNLVREIESRVTNEFGQSTKLKEKYLEMMTFHVTNTELQWSQMFGMLARMKEEMAISEYALTQMTLDQVFLVFTKKSN